MLLKHPNNRTVAMEIIKSFYVPEKSIWKLKVRWWKISSKYPPQDMRITQRVTLTRAQHQEWKVYK